MRVTQELPTIVIGAGLSGLAAGLSLSRQGHPVIVLEAQDATGGCCSTSMSSGYTFNNGAVYVAVPSLLRASFRRLGLDFADEVELAAIARPHTTHLDNGTTVHLSTAEGSYVEGPGQGQKTQKLRDGLGKLRDQWGPVYRTLVSDVLPEEPSLVHTLGRLWKYLPRMGGKVDRLIASYFPDDDLRAAVASTLLYTGLPPDRLPSTQIIGLVALLEEGFHLPRAGMGAISAALERALRNRSVPVRLGAKVREIAVQDGRVHGVVLSGGERIPAARVIATCSGLDVVRNLLQPHAAPRGLVKKADGAPLSHRAVSIQIGYAGTPAADSFVVNHVPPMDAQGALHTLTPEVPRWFAYTQPTQVLPELAPANRNIIELYAPATGMHSASEWGREMTEAVVESHLEAIRKQVPDISIETIRVIDPPDFAQKRHLYEGALYGIAPGASPNTFLPHRTQIRGLYLGGQTTFPGYGLPSAILSGIQSAEALLGDLAR